MSLRASRLLPYLATVGGSMSVVVLAIAFAIPASLEAVESHEPVKTTVRISYGQELPQLSAAEMNITYMLPVKVEKPLAQSVPAALAPSAADEPIGRQDRYVISASSLNIRGAPSSTSAIAASLSQGSEIEVVEIKGSWRKVRHDGRILGWAYDKYLQPAKQADERVASLH